LVGKFQLRDRLGKQGVEEMIILK